MFLLTEQQIGWIIVGVVALLILFGIAGTITAFGRRREEKKEAKAKAKADAEAKEAKQAKKLAKKNKPKKTKKNTVKYQGKYVIECHDEKYIYKLLASNGQSLIVSEPYTSEKGCRTGINTLKLNLEDGMIKIDADKHGLYYFTLVSKQNRSLCQSANYTTKEQAIKASESFRNFASTDNVVFDEEAVKSATEKLDVPYELKDKGKIEIYNDKNEYYYVLKASNGVKLAISQSYKTLASAKEAVERFKDIVYTGDFVLTKDKNFNYQFKLYKANRLVIVGEVYSTKAQVVSSVASIKAFTKNATVTAINIIEE